MKKVNHIKVLDELLNEFEFKYGSRVQNKMFVNQLFRYMVNHGVDVDKYVGFGKGTKRDSQKIHLVFEYEGFTYAVDLSRKYPRRYSLEKLSEVPDSFVKVLFIIDGEYRWRVRSEDNSVNIVYSSKLAKENTSRNPSRKSIRY